MPPVRSVPVKTERTHEENQERAYIAASRRSDRSLEARVESARRASEIHKKRTGRALRVTEEDVINEEMYEEEDDDLPRRFQGIPSHLKTQDEDYNRRLHAYLVHSLAMRQAVGQRPQQYPYGNPTFGPQMGMQPQPNNQMYQRHQPYPSSNPGMQMGMHSRSASTSAASGIPQNNMPPTPQLEQARRNSTSTVSPSHQESIKQESTPINSQPTTPAMPSNFQKMHISSPQVMTAPHVLSQDVYPGAEGFYKQVFTSELPQNVQMMGFPANGNDFSTSNSSTFGYNTPAYSSPDRSKPMQQSYRGSRALDQTLPYMPPGSQGESTTLSRQPSFQGVAEVQSEVQKYVPEQTNSDEWDVTLFDDTSYENYADDFLNIPSGSQETQNGAAAASPVNDGF